MDHSEVKHLPKVDHTPAEMSEESQLLLKAASIVEQKGHTKNQLCSDYDPEHGSVCLLGALNHAQRGSAWFGDDQQSKAVREIAGRVYGGSWIKAVAWNNAPERTQTEVVSALRMAALGL